MALGALRAALRPVVRTLASRPSSIAPSTTAPHFTPATATSLLRSVYTLSPSPIPNHTLVPSSITRMLWLEKFRKNRPVNKRRIKRAELRPKGPYAFVLHKPGEPIPVSQPNAGSVKNRGVRKDAAMHHAYVVRMREKRRAEAHAATKKKLEKRVERKMAKVARERVWTQRLAELQKIEAEKKISVA